MLSDFSCFKHCIMCSITKTETFDQLPLSSLIKNIIEELTVKKPTKKLSIVKINTTNLPDNGELQFPTSIIAWTGYIEDDIPQSCNIFEYYVKKKKKFKKDMSQNEVTEEAINSLVSLSKDWPFRIEKGFIGPRNDQACIFLNRLNTITTVIKTTIERGQQYGNRQSVGSKTFNLRIDPNKHSLTQTRLEMIKHATTNILHCQGYEVSDKDYDYNYVLTTKSKGKVDDENCCRFICGVVKDRENALTFYDYFEQKKEQILENYRFRIDSDDCLKKIVEAMITFEMLSVKPSRTISVKSLRDDLCDDQGARFVLYNVTRIAAIFSKYSELEDEKCYPKLLDVNEIDFSLLIQEEEWHLVYSYILLYPEMLHNSCKIEPNFSICPQHICSFLLKLCQVFSTYYHKTRILVEDRPHLVPTMMARMYLLKALHNVILNALHILGLEPVEYM